MSRKVSYIPKEVLRIEDIIWLFAEYCPTGLACFFGEAEFPAAEDLSSMVAARYTPAADVGRIDGGQSTPQQQIVVESALSVKDILNSVGGLEMVRKVFILYGAEKPDKARILKEMSFIGRSFRYPSAEEFAYRNHMSPRQFYRCKESSIRQIAWEIYRRATLSGFCA